MPTVVAVKKKGVVCIGADLLYMDSSRYTAKNILNLERIVKVSKDVYMGALEVLSPNNNSDPRIEAQIDDAN